jgi:MFS transporter, CP family, cyanate transporter
VSQPDPAANRARVPLAAVAALFLASVALRPQILAIGPLLPLIRADLGLSAGIAGLLTTIPVLCMGIFAPFGPRIAARLGARTALTVCLGLLAGFGLVRAVSPNVPLILLSTLAIGVGIGMAGAIPSMVVSQRISMRPALGTGAYAGGIVLGSAMAAAVAIPLAGAADDWRRALLVISLATLLPIAAWLLLIRPDPNLRPLEARAPRLPWRSVTGWLLVAIFGLQSLLFYGVVSWLPNVFVERGWTPGEAGSLVAIFNGIGLFTTLGVPLIADRLGDRRRQIVIAAVIATVALFGVAAMPTYAVAWVALLGLALGMIFPLVLTLPIDVSDEPAQVGSVAALMLFGGYFISAAGPVLLGAARDLTGDFETSLWLLVVFGLILIGACASLSTARLHRGIGRGS